ncbi:unnamed protein product [Plutella xylostella]|uniref:(diamondback moth) hypothetical protein n=1 Tax=Plutella xylostella TaxID=51655 RepID=A0A8S4EJA7_PLUXY|nr:mucin-5AC [Plutella xylostella]XP_037961525.1 mucin-5AC [Plutella xylostella]CAG9115639.1 unnamed protein product [Plutella xylostella]
MASKVVTVSLFYIFCFNLVASYPLTKDYQYSRVGADQNERLSSNSPLQNRQFNSNPQQYEDPNKPSKPGPWNFKNLSVQQKLLIENLLRKQFLERNKQWTGSQYNRPVQKTSYSTLPNSGQTVKIENPHRLPVTGNPPSFVNNNHNTNTQRFAPVNIANLQNNRNGMTANEVKRLHYGSNNPDSDILNKSVFISETGILNTGQSGNKVKSTETIQQYGSVNSHNHAENLGIKPVTNNANAQSTFTTALQGFKSGSNDQKIMSYADVLKLLQSTNINGNNGERTSVVTNQYNTQTASVPDPLLLSSVPVQHQNTQVQNSASVPITSVPASRQFLQKSSTFKPIPAPPASSSMSSTSSIYSTDSLPSQPRPDATAYSESASSTSSENVVQPSPLIIPTTKTENDSQDSTKNLVNSEPTVITSESTSGAPENIIITSESAVSAAADAGGEDDDDYDDGDDDDGDDEDFPPSMWFSTSDPTFLTKLFGNAPLGVVYFYNAPKPIPEIDQ